MFCTYKLKMKWIFELKKYNKKNHCIMNLQSFLSAVQHQVLHWTEVLSTPPQSVERYLKIINVRMQEKIM